jgi:hypothetical protein
VVQAQLGKARNAARLDDRDRLLVAQHGQHGLVQAHGLLEQLSSVLTHPAVPKRYARRAPVVVLRVGAIVHRLPEERDPRLVPQALAEKEWRVGGDGERHRGGRLGRVVGARIGARIDAQMDLERGVGALERDLMRAHRQGIVTVDADLEGLAADAQEPRREGAVALGV